MRNIVFILSLVCVVAVTNGEPDNYNYGTAAARRNTGEFGGTFSYYGRDKKVASDHHYSHGYRQDDSKYVNDGKKEPGDGKYDGEYKGSGYDRKDYDDAKYGDREYGREGRTYKNGEEHGRTGGASW